MASTTYTLHPVGAFGRIAPCAGLTLPYGRDEILKINYTTSPDEALGLRDFKHTIRWDDLSVQDKVCAYMNLMVTHQNKEIRFAITMATQQNFLPQKLLASEAGQTLRALLIENLFVACTDPVFPIRRIAADSLISQYSTPLKAIEHISDKMVGLSLSTMPQTDGRFSGMKLSSPAFALYLARGALLYGVVSAIANYKRPSNGIQSLLPTLAGKTDELVLTYPEYDSNKRNIIETALGDPQSHNGIETLYAYLTSLSRAIEQESSFRAPESRSIARPLAILNESDPYLHRAFPATINWDALRSLKDVDVGYYPGAARN